jgi:mRNA-degrading endonuclease RelE of RelBE toxin-antitoxin system
MYQVLVERAAEKDLKRLSAGIRSRIAIALRGLAENPRPTGSRKLAALSTTGASEWAITGSSTRSRM